MANTYPLQVITPVRVMLAEDVEMTIAPGVDGDLGVLANHAPLMTTLRAGEIRAIFADGRTTSHIVEAGGLMEVGKAGVVILVDNAERSDEIDVTRAETDLAEARRMVADLPAGSMQWRQAIAGAEHAEARIRVGRGNGS